VPGVHCVLDDVAGCICQTLYTGGGHGESSGGRGGGGGEGSTGSRLGAMSDFASPPMTMHGDSDDDEAYGGQGLHLSTFSSWRLTFSGWSLTPLESSHIIPHTVVELEKYSGKTSRMAGRAFTATTHTVFSS